MALATINIEKCDVIFQRWLFLIFRILVCLYFIYEVFVVYCCIGLMLNIIQFLECRVLKVVI
jgi:hypothetical protein